jgi:hypothetical protein
MRVIVPSSTRSSATSWWLPGGAFPRRNILKPRDLNLRPSASTLLCDKIVKHRQDWNPNLKSKCIPTKYNLEKFKKCQCRALIARPVIWTSSMFLTTSFHLCSVETSDRISYSAVVGFFHRLSTYESSHHFGAAENCSNSDLIYWCF